MRNFQLLAGAADTTLLLQQILTNSQLWNQHTLRTEQPASPHKKVDDIWLRFNPTEQFTTTGNPTSIVDGCECVWYPAASVLSAARALIFDLARRVEAERIGRVIITRLKPGATITPHVDNGLNAQYYSRYHIVLCGLPGSVFRAGSEQAQMLTGSCWWFDNQQNHECRNESIEDRIHLIVDLHTAANGTQDVMDTIP